MNSEAIYQAFFGLLSGSASFQTSSRRLKHWSDVPPEEQPALFVCQKERDVESKRTNLPGIWHLEVQVWIYAWSADPDQVPSSVLNPLVDAVRDAISPNGGSQTLGGLVTACQISGKIEDDEGLLGDQAVAMIPVTILVPG